jgi:transcriptional antiterminator RfaH
MDELHQEQIDEVGWYCVHTKPKCEHIAAAHLLQLHEVEVFCPRIRFRRPTKRGKIWFTEALFPGYIFARFVPRTSFRGVSHATGVIRILRFGQRLASLSDDSIEAIRSQVGDGHIKEIDPVVNVGDEIKVVQGPMAGFTGIVTHLLSGEHRVKVLLEFLGRENLVDVHVEKITTGISPRAFVSDKNA